VPLQQALWHVYHGVTDKPLCKQCKINPVGFTTFTGGYYDYCSVHCVTQSSERNAKIAHNNDYVAIQAKVMETNLKKYGVEHFFASDVGKNKAKQGLIASLGVDNPGLSPTIKEKMATTCLERYGVEHVYNSSKFQKQCQNAKLAKYGSYFPGCEEIQQSNGEVEFRDWLNTLGFDFKSNNQILPHGLELDCYDPLCVYAFEYCGLYWHSTKFKHHFYHRNKMNLAMTVGIQLITVFEDEWLNRTEQVKSFIRAKMGHFDRRLYARKCELVDVSVKQGKQFMLNNHIQGASSTAGKYIGLAHGGELVGLASFSRHHRNGKLMTLSRLAFSSGVQVVGGMSRLIDATKKQVGSFVTWSDNRWTDGKSYGLCGLINDRNVAADYSYVVKNKRVPKQQMTKKALGCPAEVTESEFCRSKGWYQIYDCGKKRWTYQGESNAVTDQC
jgi:hypothetical protein